MDSSLSNLSAPAPRVLGRYELVQLLGQGGMGEVYLAKISGAAGFEKPCIVKTVLPALLKDRQFLDRFHHEAKVLVHLAHSSIAQVYDMGEAEGTYYMALEYVAGVDLAYLQEQARAQGKSIPVPVALYLGQRIAEGLGYAHRKMGPDGAPLGIVHRDVSPHNVMVSYEGEVKVIDFGLAKSAARSKYTLPATVMGKLGYMSPEQVRAESVDHRTDLYSCGVVVWELLAGRPLIAPGTVGEMMAAMAQPTVPSLSELRADVDPALDAAVRRALAPAPEERYARADDFARALNEHFLRTGSSVGAEEVGNFVREICPEAFSSQRELISRLSTASTTRRTPLPPAVVLPMNTGVQFAPTGDGTPQTLIPMTPPPAQGLADTLMRPSSAQVPTVGVSPESLQLQGPGRKGWLVAISLAALGLVGASAGITAVVMTNRRPPHRVLPDGRPPFSPDQPPFGGGPHGPRGPGEHHGPHGRPPGSFDPRPAPGEPPEAPKAAPEAIAAKPSVAKPSSVTPVAARFISAENVAAIRPTAGSSYFVPQGRNSGLTPGMVLQVVEAPTRDGKAKVLGEATVREVLPRRATLSLDESARGAAKSARFVVLPEPKETPEEPPRPPSTKTEPATPTRPAAPEPRQLNGRIAQRTGPFGKKIELTNTDNLTWSGCILVTQGRDMYKLGGMAPGGSREILLSAFEKGGREVPFVNSNRLGLFCTEGEREFPFR
ncbi:serine/threonine protein kinase [Cystobacter ferrugineus]|uniref:serine/threonine protein kinase n=1 Tax=Cystobacter ferrugineus TaxID=83449 RepID=UPI0009034D39|nr:serine/threonine-protein kinase [Cystobacter ferrugineus]